MSEQEKVVESTVQQEAEKATEILANTLHADTEAVVSAKALLNVGAHLGHQVRRQVPKMKPYIYGTKNNLHILDLAKTVTLLQKAYLELRKIVLDGGKVLFVGTKPSAQTVIKEEANRCGSFYVSTRWLGGCLTNFKTISKRIRLLKELEDQNEQGLFEKLSKKDQNTNLKLLARLKNNLDGIKEMRRTPNAVVVVDAKWEHNAVAEAKKLGIPVFAMMDTNSDPTDINYVIPANDDNEQSVRLVIGILADAVAEAKGGNCLYAYKDAEAVSQTMSEMLKELDKNDELKAIKSKLKDDSYALHNKEKKKAIRKAYAKKKQNEALRAARAEQEKLAQQQAEATAATEEKTEEKAEQQA